MKFFQKKHIAFSLLLFLLFASSQFLNNNANAVSNNYKKASKNENSSFEVEIDFDDEDEYISNDKFLKEEPEKKAEPVKVEDFSNNGFANSNNGFANYEKNNKEEPVKDFSNNSFANYEKNNIEKKVKQVERIVRKEEVSDRKYVRTEKNKNNSTNTTRRRIIKRTNTTSGDSDFFSTYINRSQNPIFNDKKHMIGILGNYDMEGVREPPYYEGKKRQLFIFAVHYSRAFKVFGLNCRFSIGAFSMFGRDYLMLRGKLASEEIRTFGGEGIVEVVIGHPMLYLTAGAGVSYMRGKNGFPVGYGGLTYFNFVPVVAIGHRFDNNFAVEIIYKHYSNGNDYMGRNKGVNSLGIALRYSF